MLTKPFNNKVQCPICNQDAEFKFSAPDRHYGNKGEWNVFSCKNCKHYFQNPILTDKELEKFYPKTYYSFQPPNVDYKIKGIRGIRTRLVFYYMRYFQKYKRLNVANNFMLAALGLLFKPNKALQKRYPVFVENGKYLDYGCGSGRNVAFAAYTGWDTYGIEISQSAVDAGKKAGLNISQGSIDKLREYNSFFDIIYSNHCVEHVSDVKQLFQAFHNALKPDGKLLVEVPNGSAYALTKFKEHFCYLGMPVHVHLFSTQSMKLIAEASGFKNIQLTTYSVWDLHAKSFFTKHNQSRFKEVIQFDQIDKSKLFFPKIFTWLGYLYSKKRLKGDNLILYVKNK